MSSSPVLMPDLFYRTRNGIFAPCVLLAAGQLDLFTALRDGPRTIAQLAAAIGAKPDKLRIPLNVLVLAGLLKRHGETVANRPESRSISSLTVRLAMSASDGGSTRISGRRC